MERSRPEAGRIVTTDSRTGFGRKALSGLLWGQFGMSARTFICFAVSIMVARSLGVENYGVYAAIGSMLDMLMMFSEMGSQPIISTWLPRLQAEQKPGELSYMMRRVLFCRLLLMAVILVLVHLFAKPFADTIGSAGIAENMLAISAWFIIRSLMDPFIFMVMARLDMRFYSAVEVFVSVVQFAGVAAMIFTGTMTVPHLIVLMMIVHGSQLVGYGFRSREIFLTAPVAMDLRRVARFGALMWLANSLQFFRLKSIDIFMILYYVHDSASVAYYEIAYLLAITGGSVLLAVVQLLVVPIFSEAHARFGMDGLRDAWTFLTKVSAFLSVPIYVFLVIHAENIIRIFYTDAYMGCRPLIVAFSLFTVFGIVLGGKVSVYVTFPLRMEKTYLFIRGANGIANLLLNILLIPRYGAIGAVISTGGTKFLSSLFEYGIARKHIGVRLPAAFFLQLILISSLAGIGTLLLGCTNVFALVGSGALYAVVVSYLTLRLHRFSEKEMSIVRQMSPAAHALLVRHVLRESAVSGRSELP